MRACGGCNEYLAGDVPVHVPDHDRRQREHRRDADDRCRPRRGPARTWCRSASSRRAGAGRCTQVWAASEAPILAYMDVDLSTDLAALLPLVAPLISGHSDLAIGSRLPRGSRVVRGPKREMISRCYNLILRGALSARFSDAQCGFKAIRRDVAARLLPLVEDNAWFFDTELLVLAQRAGLRIHEVPVDWVDDPDSRVDIVSTALADLRGIWRLGQALATGCAADPGAARRSGPGRAAPRRGRDAGGAGRARRPAGPLRRRRHREHAGVPAAVRAPAHRHRHRRPRTSSRCSSRRSRTRP